MKVCFACLLTTIVFLQANDVHAETWFSRSFDYHLLRSDAVVFATVEDLTPRQGGVTTVQLTNLNVVSSRWSGMSSTLELTALGTLEAGELKAVQHQPSLVKGSRYLFFLRGGDYEFLPILTGTQAVFQLDAGGVVLCAGGQIYGLGPRKFNCSVPDRQVGKPVDESSLANQLRIAMTNARSRKPTFAQQEDAAQRQLKTSPKARP